MTQWVRLDERVDASLPASICSLGFDRPNPVGVAESALHNSVRFPLESSAGCRYVFHIAIVPRD